jgi:ABC-type multidrug transport system permease subunit
MTKSEIIIAALAIAFTFVNLVFPQFVKTRFFKRRPFNCIMCMSGWSSLGLALINGYGYGSILFLFLGIFAGAMFEGISMRWL